MLVVGCIRALGELDLDLEVVEAGAVYKSPLRSGLVALARYGLL